MMGLCPGPDLAPASARPRREDYRALYETAPCGYLTLRRDGTVLDANRTLLDWVGRRLDAAGPVVCFREFLTAPSWVVFALKCVPVLTMHGQVQEIALDLRRADGSILPVLASFQRVGGEEGRDQPIRGTLFDATERRLYERELLAARTASDAARRAAEEAGARLSTVLESTTDGVLLVGADWGVSYANPSALRLLDASLVGGDLRDGFPGAAREPFAAVLEAAMAGQAPGPVQGPVGEGWIWVRAHPAPDGGVAVFFRDVTLERRAEEERRRVAERIEHMATHDALTGLPNRTLFAARLRAALSVPGGGVAVLCLDLDRFKQVNDRLGHAAGDMLLKAVAGRLRAALRAEDTVARFGGDEFAVVLAGTTRGGQHDQARHAEAVAARLIRTLGAPYAIGIERAEIGASVGITMASGRDIPPDALLEEADLALYQAKRSGRGRHAVFRQAMLAEQRSRLEMEAALRHAIEAGELLLHYQPVVDVATGAVRGHEALVRWNRPGHGLVPPASFIPVAEETGLIVELGDRVLRQACRDAASWPGPSLRLAVNLSPLQLRDASLPDRVSGALAQGGLAPGRLELEITESALLERSAPVLDTLHRLRGLGISLAMDDFGTGFSSLASLRAFPFGRVKIDRSFVRDAETRDQDMAIVEAVAALARRLGMACTGEGVETEGQLKLLARAGCTEAQGYLLGRPMPQADVLRALASGPATGGG
jgi:diguanylate cyclase (GGDEF)-like protein